MFEKGKRIFSSATILQFLIAVLHTLGLFNKPVDQEGVALLESMRNYKMEMGVGMRPSVLDVQMSLGLTMTVLIVFLGIMNIVVLYGSPTAGLLRRVALLDAVCMCSLAVLYGVYQIPPPLISFVVLGFLYTIAFVRMPKT